MPKLFCHNCGKEISATHKECPHCGEKVCFLGELVFKIEHNKLYLAGVVILALLLLGAAWFLRMDSGAKWPLYLLIILLAPVVPWVLRLVYKAAAPVPDADGKPDADGDN